MHSGTDNVVLLSIYDRFTRKDVPWPDDPEGKRAHALDLAARQAANARKNAKKAATAPKMASGRPDHYLSASESDSDDSYGPDVSLENIEVAESVFRRLRLTAAGIDPDTW